jgi:DNA-binding NarL/FixJ family response regulator
MDSDDEPQLLGALEILDGLEATPAAAKLRRQLRRLGVQRVPRGPRKETRSHPAGLTPRQVDVLQLLADGLTNADIAERLFISPKTVDHHVSAVLTKLEASTRREAVVAARDRGFA